MMIKRDKPMREPIGHIPIDSLIILLGKIFIN